MIEKIYIGGYSDNISICEFNNGNLKIVNKVDNIINPSYLHINNDMLYAVSETQSGSVFSFKIKDYNLKLINSKEINESLPCYITTNKKRNSLLIANYGSGSICMYQLNEDGSIEKEIYIKTYMKNSNMHYAEFIEDNIYAVDLANDVVYIYDLDMELVSKIDMEKKSGPRHLTMSKDNKKIYIVTELSNEVFVYKNENNNIQLIQKISSLANRKQESFAGAIRISNNNKNIYVTNRGDNSISVFEVNDNKLELIQNISSYGEFPRDIILNNSEEYVLVANQKSNNIVTFKRDIENGRLLKIEGADLKLEKPSCLVRSSYEI